MRSSPGSCNPNPSTILPLGPSGNSIAKERRLKYGLSGFSPDGTAHPRAPSSKIVERGHRQGWVTVALIGWAGWARLHSSASAASGSRRGARPWICALRESDVGVRHEKRSCPTAMFLSPPRQR